MLVHRKPTGPRGRVLLATAGATCLALALVPSVASAAKIKNFDVVTQTTVEIIPATQDTATYKGVLSVQVKNKSHNKEVRQKQNRLAEHCLANRQVDVWHFAAHIGFHIGVDSTSLLGSWEVVGNRPPSGDPVTIEVLPIQLGKARCNGTFAVAAAP